MLSFFCAGSTSFDVHFFASTCSTVNSPVFFFLFFFHVLAARDDDLRGHRVSQRTVAALFVLGRDAQLPGLPLSHGHSRHKGKSRRP